MLKKPFLLLLFLCFGVKAFCAVFVVTSNADSGPGTLRDALTQAAANGSVEKDYINFNFADQSEAGRTITISSQLPFISSNIVIDGTTQPGVAFGVSNAKVILQPDSSASVFDPFILINITGFEIYGMYIRDFLGVAPFKVSTVFYTNNSSNVQIGAPGKGNVICNNGYIISPGVFAYYSGTTTLGYGVYNLTMSANFLGFEPDGKTFRGSVIGYSGSVDFGNCKGNIVIGGDDTSQRNIFGHGAMYLRNSGTSLYQSNILIKNNYFDYDVNGQPVQMADINADGSFAIFIQNTTPSFQIDYPYNLDIINNKIQFPLQVQAGEITGQIFFKGNQTLMGSGYVPNSVGIGLSADSGVFVGGVQPGEANVIYGDPVYINSKTSILLHRNSIYCVNVDNQIVWDTNTQNDVDPRLPIININTVTNNSVSGTATPLSQIELFEDDSCQLCEPLTYFATLNADANGNWNFSGPIKRGVIASATLNGFTSLFTMAGVINAYNVVQSSCSVGGSVIVANSSNSGGYSITDANNNVVSTNTNAQNLKPGKYTLSTENFTCSNTYPIQIYDATPIIDSDNVKIIQPGCGKNNGSITGLLMSNNDIQVYQSDYGAYSFKWIDAGGNQISNGSDLNNVGPGVYHLVMSYKTGCSTTYGPVTLKNTTGPNIDQSNVKVQSTNCGQSTGSITNIPATGTGTLTYSWTNSAQQTVSTDSILVNQLAGTYTLKVTDGTQCGPVYSSAINIPETNGITIDSSKLLITPSSCGIANGSVVNLTVAGATSYQWLNANGSVVSTSLNLSNATAGKYLFVASNNFGCSKILTCIIPQQAAIKLPAYTATITTACNAANSGGITVATDAQVTSARWLDSTGKTIANTSTLSNVFAGTYQLYLTDQSGCESFYKSYTVPAYHEFTIANYGTPAPDECGLHNGGVSATTVAGGVSPYTYRWTDINGNLLSTSSAISNLTAGTYYLNIADVGGCGSVTITYTILGGTEALPAPSVSDVQLCSSGSGLITVNNPQENNTYRLYGSQNGMQPIDEQKGGRFTINVTGNSTYYISEVDGSCESSRTQVNVTVGLSTINIANTFTPNGDGINDYWQITGIESYPTALVQIFNRYGQKLFESKGYGTPFDGTYKGQKIPAGVYYYIINLNTKCNLLSGSLTILR